NPLEPARRPPKAQVGAQGVPVARTDRTSPPAARRVALLRGSYRRRRHWRQKRRGSGTAHDRRERVAATVHGEAARVSGNPRQQRSLHRFARHRDRDHRCFSATGCLRRATELGTDGRDRRSADRHGDWPARRAARRGGLQLLPTHDSSAPVACQRAGARGTGALVCRVRSGVSFMAATQENQDDMITGINVTPLVDVVLVLLIILMVTASYIVSKAIPMDLPNASTGQSTQTPLAISVDKDERLYL